MGESAMVSRTIGFARGSGRRHEDDPGRGIVHDYQEDLVRGPTASDVLLSITTAAATRRSQDMRPEPAREATPEAAPVATGPGEGKVLIFSFRAHDDVTAEHIQNRITAWYSGARYIHCEVYDPHLQRAFFITTTSGGLQFKERGFLPKRWHFLYAKVSEVQYQRFRHFVNETMRYPKQFDTWNIWGMPLAGLIEPTTPGCTTCARETANLIGYVWGIRLEKLDFLYSPDDVAEWLVRLCDTVTSGIRSINTTSNPNPVRQRAQ
jgi:hypothetical protein